MSGYIDWWRKYFFLLFLQLYYYIHVQLAIPECLLLSNAQKEERRNRQHTEGLETDS
jgi:hypothetical protein